MTALNRTELTPLLFIERSAGVHANRVGAIYGQRRFTYRELGDRVRRLATALRRAGLQRGERVAVLAPNLPALLDAHFGVALAGGVLVAINTRLNADEVGYIIDHCGARLFIVDAELAQGLGLSRAALGAVEAVITIDDPEFAPGVPHVYEGPEYEAFIAVDPEVSLPFRVPSEDDMLSINYTSGTTGRPKGVVYTHRSAYLNALAEMVSHRVDPSSRFLWTLPMFHCNGWCFPWAVTGAGGSHLLLRRIDPPLVWRLIRTEGVTHFNAAPTVLIMLINDPAAPGERLKRPLRIATGGAPPSPTLLAQWERLGAEITHLYGLTETYGPHTYCDWQPEWNGLDADARAKLRARQGVPNVVACEVRVVNEHMDDVQADGQTMAKS